jgi:hypothetical protein
MQLAVEQQQKGYGVLGHAPWSIGRNPSYPQTDSGSGSEIDPIIAGATHDQSTHALFSQGLERRGAGIIVDESAGGLAAGGKYGGRGVEAGFVKDDLDTRGSGSGGEGRAVVGFGAEEGEAEGLHGRGLAVDSVMSSEQPDIHHPYTE